MTFFKRHPKLWIAVWSVFGLGGLLMAGDAIFGDNFDLQLLVKGLIGTALAGMMIGYLLPELRNNHA